MLDNILKTKQTNDSTQLTDWLTSIGTLASVIVSLSIALYSFYLTRRNEQHQALTNAFHLLNDNAHRNARRRICNLYQEEDQSRKIKILKQMGLKDEDMKRIDAIHTESKDIVKADFEQLGSLIENKAIPKKDFLRMYWHDVLKCWTVLNQEITKFRNQTKDNNHMINFEKLYNYSTPFKKTKQLQVKDLFIHPEVNYATPLLATPDSQKYKIRIGFDIPIENLPSQIASSRFLILVIMKLKFHMSGRGIMFLMQLYLN